MRLLASLRFFSRFFPCFCVLSRVFPFFPDWYIGSVETSRCALFFALQVNIDERELGKTLNFSFKEIVSARSGVMSFPRVASKWFSKLFLVVLKLLVYSESSLLTMTFLSLYGLVHGVACVPRKRVSALKSLLRYGVQVLQHGLESPIQGSAKS